MKYAHIISVVIVLSILLSFSVSAFDGGGQKAYDSYTYSQVGGSIKQLPSPAPFLPMTIVSGSNIGCGKLSDPSDLFVDETNNRIFIADTANNRIIITDLALKYITSIFQFLDNGGEQSLNQPTGVFLSSDDKLYVADKGSGRVLRFDCNNNYSIDKIFIRPDTRLISSAIDYKPSKVAVSTMGNIYIICEGIYEGIVEINEDNEFQGYVGMNLVAPNFWQIFLRSISTKVQKSAMTTFLPINFSNMDIDKTDFIYATSQLEGNNSQSAVKRLNPGGTDVLTNNTSIPISGDIGILNRGRNIGKSLFTDIAYLNNGIYICLDATRSKLFTYDADGQLLFAFGGSGSQYGNITGARAVDNCGDTLYVLDGVKGNIIIYSPTEYGKTVLKAVGNYQQGLYDKVQEDYQYILFMNSNSEIAYSGLGKVLLRQGEYKKAMKYFSLANNKVYYSKALSHYREELFSKYFGIIFAVVVIILAFFILRKSIKKIWRKNHIKSEIDDSRSLSKIDRYASSVEYFSFLCFHPFKGFYELKREKIGTLSASFTFVGLFLIVSLCKNTLTGFLTNNNDMQTANIFLNVILSIVPMLLFVVANWCFTTLMDGDGTLKDIFIATSYSLTPYILLQIFIIIFSNFTTIEETSLLTVLEVIAIGYTFFLIFIGNMVTHQYTGTKTIGMILLTVIGMAIIIFIGFLFVNLCSKVWEFVASIYKELTYRF